MTTATATLSNWTLAGGRTRPSLEELVDRLIAALFREQPETATPTATQSVARSVHDARRLRKAGDFDGALAVLGGVDTARVETKEARWAYAEWLAKAKRRFGDRELLGVCPRIRSWRRKPPRNNLLTAICTLSWSN